MTSLPSVQIRARSAIFGAVLSSVLMSAGIAHAQETLRLWDGAAPGVETWHLPEQVSLTPSGDIQAISNVVEPTITVYLPEAAIANGAAVLILPGGGLRGLGWRNSIQQAQWLNGLGVAAIILKYRTLQIEPAAPGARTTSRQDGPELPVGLEIRNANANPDPTNPALSQVLEMAVADAQNAMRLVRQNAVEWRINPDKVGMMGLSAGGGVAVGAVIADAPGTAPNFLVSLYGPSLQDVVVPADAPPLFIAVGADHQPVANGLMALHSVWKDAGRSSELHIYDGVRQGLGAWGGDAPVERWPDRLQEWLIAKAIIPTEGGR